MTLEPSQVSSGRRSPLVRRILNLALLVALGPAILLTVSALGVNFGLMRWGEGFAAAAADLAPRLAYLSVVTGVLALTVAVAAGFGRYWLRAFIALTVTVATLGALLWVRAQALAPG